MMSTLRALLSKRELDAKKLSARYEDTLHSLQHEVEDEHDAFLLDPGTGPMAYLTADGRVLIDGRSWDGTAIREATDDEAIGALVSGATKTGLAELLTLLPACPADGSTCTLCHGARRAQPYPGVGPELVCLLCRGRGWVTEALLADARSTGSWPRRG